MSTAIKLNLVKFHSGISTQILLSTPTCYCWAIQLLVDRWHLPERYTQTKCVL